MTYNILLEKLLKDIGGCGKFQWVVAVTVSFSIITECWSMFHMSFMGQEPNFFCSRNNISQNHTGDDVKKSCIASNLSDCTQFQFGDEIHTIVSQWSLVCDKEWIVATITTLQMAGVLVGCFVAGQLGDWFGRKPSYYFSIVSLVVLNVIAYFSVGWEMYATVRFLIGIGLGFCISNQLNLVCEFLTSTWRPIYIAFPTWCVVAGAFALLAWLVKDWKNIHLATAIVGAPFLLSWWVIQESFRWLITRGRYEEATSVINKIAATNGQQLPDLTEIVEQAKHEDAISAQHRYSVLDLFKTRENIIKSAALIFIWAAMSYAYYGLTFGIQNMAGDLYLNMFLSNVIEVPANLITMYIVNRFGRKKWCIISYLFTGLCGIGNGILQQLGTPVHDVLVNVFALGSRLGLAAGWTAQAVMTIEVYPTVVRGTAYGMANTAARIGGMIAPQIVFVNNHIPGILFFLSAAVMIISSLLCFLFTETKDKHMEDTMNTSTAKGKPFLVVGNKSMTSDKKSARAPQNVDTLEKINDEGTAVTKF